MHFEVKFVERLNVYDAMEQARHDARRVGKSEVRNPKSEGEKVPIVVHRRNCWPWLVTMSAETFFRVLRGELPPQPKLDSRAPARSAPEGPLPAANSFRRFPSDSNLRGEFPRDGTGAVRQEPSKTQNDKEQMT